MEVIKYSLSTWITIFVCPRDKRSGGILFLSCLSFCNSVFFFETLTFLITFEQWVLELWYFTWVFLVIKRPFSGYYQFLHCDLDLGGWPNLKKNNFNLAYNFWTVSAKVLLYTMSISSGSTGIKIFDLVTLVIFGIGPIIGGICVSQTNLIYDVIYN